MRYSTSTPWLDAVVLSSSAERSGRRSEFYRAAREGQYLRLASGVFIGATVWAELGADDRYLARVHAAALTSRPGIVFSHFSAAALWRLPLLGQWPARPEITVGREFAGPSRLAFTARQFDIPESEQIDGLAVTPLARTLIDIGRTAELATSVAMMDHALSPVPPGTHGIAAARVTRAQLESELRSIDGSRGRGRCGIALDLADGESGSPGESLSRVAMHLLKLPAPILQHAFYDERGLIGFADFWWPEHSLIGEFDGNGKYLRDEFLAGRTAAEVVIAEKVREDRLRALGPKVTRWGWTEARSPQLLARHLRAAGLR